MWFGVGRVKISENMPIIRVFYKKRKNSCHYVKKVVFQVSTLCKTKKITERYKMLILTRKLGESVIVGDNIRITVVKIDKQQIKLGIDASKNVIVDREEIVKKKKRGK